MRSDVVFTLDLGSTKVTCAAASMGEQGLTIQAIKSIACKGVRKGVLTDIDEATRAIDAAVRAVSQEMGQEIQSLVVAISGTHLEGMNAQGLKPIVPRGRHITFQDVLEVINHSRSVVLPPDREQIQALPREFRVDGTRDVRKPIGMSGAKLEVVTYIVTGYMSAVQNLDRAVTMANRKVEQMVLAPLAAGIGVLTQEEMDLGAVVVDIGGGTTDVAVFSNGSIAHSACLPVASGHVTSDISKLLKTSPEEAERLKIEHGCAFAKSVSEADSVSVMQLGQMQSRALQRRVLAEIAESRMREIATMVKQQIEKSGLYAMLPGGVVLTGGGAMMEGVDKAFEDVLKHLRVRVGQPDLPAKFARETGAAVSVGMARFALQCYDELAPASGVQTDWKDRVKTLFSMMSGR
jgi:cell division protein FtsA